MVSRVYVSPAELPLSTLMSMIGSAESLPVPNLHRLNAAGELVLLDAPGDEAEERDHG